MRDLKQLVVFVVLLILFSTKPFIAYCQEPSQKPSIVKAPLFGESKHTNLWGELPPLKRYYEPPKQLVIRQPRSKKLIYDHIVLPSNPLAVVDAMNIVISILGGLGGAKELPGSEGNAIKKRYIGALRLKVFEDGTFALLQFWPYQNPAFRVNPDKVMIDLNDPCNWKFLPKDKAIRRLDAHLRYQYEISGGIDKSYGRLFMGITGYQWHPNINKGEIPKVMMSGEIPKAMMGEKHSGVYMAPTPSKEGEGGAEVKERILNSRPSEDTLFWPIELPNEEE
jgi:hypothetical protein